MMIFKMMKKLINMEKRLLSILTLHLVHLLFMTFQLLLEE
ncbi:hypothetical protein PVAP13_5NG025208 [Panicum virgatum]|uniref:Uncharacterized protein n=1 Tax=Panicum virgatum TaxID=38727 RepID=A0A8T0RMN2_PANVG|nr:hypothetical protein PVAP13_5NG025208 [Panicum virgatum]